MLSVTCAVCGKEGRGVKKPRSWPHGPLCRTHAMHMSAGNLSTNAQPCIVCCGDAYMYIVRWPGKVRTQVGPLCGTHEIEYKQGGLAELRPGNPKCSVVGCSSVAAVLRPGHTSGDTSWQHPLCKPHYVAHLGKMLVARDKPIDQKLFSDLVTKVAGVPITLTSFSFDHISDADKLKRSAELHTAAVRLHRIARWLNGKEVKPTVKPEYLN